MMKRRSIEKVKTIKKEKEKEQLIGYLDSLVILKDDVNIIKLKISHEYGYYDDTYLVLRNSLKLIRSENTRDSYVVMLDAFYKSTVVSMETCKNPLTPWNFKQENISEAIVEEIDHYYLNNYCLIRRIFEDSSYVEDLSDELTDFELDLQNLYLNHFLKIGNDEKVEYEYGGQMITSPLYFNKRLPVHSSVKRNLTKQLNKLADERKDWHEEWPVLDIIDPDLNPNYSSPTDMQKLLDENKKQLKEKDLEDEEIEQQVLTKFPESLILRSQYKWIPTEFLITKDFKVSMLGPIHNLPRQGNSELYANILNVFDKMLPGFHKLNLLKENEDTILQVVVKAQKYEIKPGMKFSGKWHIDGKTENIVATGEYYCNIDLGFEEDKLLYRQYIFPDPDHCEKLSRTPDYEIDVSDGSAVVFSNILPYKFKDLVNSTKFTLTRTILNFFIVDPSKPIECDGGKQDYWRLLKSMKLKNIIIGHILKFLSPLKYDPLEVAKEKRRLVRECMKTERSGWGEHSGDLEFFDAFHEFNNPEKYERLEEDEKLNISN